MMIEHLAADTSPDKLAEALARDGCAIVDRVVSAAARARLEQELAPWVAATQPGRDDFAGRRTRRTGGLIARSPACRELVLHPLVQGAVQRVLARATSHQLHLTQVISIGPGEPAQPIHRDQWAFDFFPFPNGYEVQCNTIWALTDFTEENGATRVIPGSHLYADKLQLHERDSLPAEMEAGSVLLYTGALYHGAGANRSAATRTGINLTYAVSWLRQEENQYLSCPPEIARTLPTPLLRLMGYARGAYALGYVDDTRDPIEVLRPEAAQDGLGALEHAQAQLTGRA
ncbi:MAG TPA: phytanoyl-CoA dioxygenase family protein [Myxococcota bacterium]|nr:phytanoyl-CoA dioxygenase family protein [Myxococcota bacterium]